MSNVATVRSLHVYPVKGCAAVDVEAIAFDADGLIVGDRGAMLVDGATGAFVSQRHQPKLARLRVGLPSAGVLCLEMDDGSATVELRLPGPTRRVTVWDDTFDAIDCGEAIAGSLSEWLRRDVRLVRLPGRSPRVIDPYWAGEGTRSSFADLAPVLVTSTASLDDLNARRAATGRSPIEMARFRPNVVIDALPAWTEDDVASLRAGDAGLRFVKPCARCKVIELDPPTGDATGDEVLASLATFRAGKNRRGTAGVFFGQNAVALAGDSGLRVGQGLEVVRAGRG